MSTRSQSFRKNHRAIGTILFFAFLVGIHSASATATLSIVPADKKLARHKAFDHKRLQRKLEPLSETCEAAEPIVLLPIEQDVSITRGFPEQAGHFSLTSSTVNATPSNGGVPSCTGAESGDVSPSLWYTFVGTGDGMYASVCRHQTNFEARISVYASNSESDQCDNLFCVIGASRRFGCLSPPDGTYLPSTSLSPSATQADPIQFDIREPCDVQWVAEAGTTYFIRVHGDTISEVGSFLLSIETLPKEHPLNEARSECDKEKMRREGPFMPECQCISDPANCGYSLTCVDSDCLKCNPDLDTCGFNSVEWEIQVREGGETSAQASRDAFYLAKKPRRGPQEMEIEKLLSSEECVEMKDPYKVCMEMKEQIFLLTGSGGDIINDPKDTFLCECRDTTETGGAMLLCGLFDEWDFCVSDGVGTSGEEALCATVMFGQTISQFGMLESTFRAFDYVVDKNRTLDVRRHVNDCEVFLDGSGCQSCESIACKNGNVDPLLEGTVFSEEMGTFTDLKVDCSNLKNGATFECGVTTKDNFLALLNGEITGNLRPPSILDPQVQETDGDMALREDPKSNASVKEDDEDTRDQESSSAVACDSATWILLCAICNILFPFALFWHSFLM